MFAATFHAAPTLQWRKTLTVVAAIVVMWAVLSTLFALTALNDDLRHGVQGNFWLMWRSSAIASSTLAVLCALLYWIFGRWPALVASTKHIAAGYVLILLLLLPWQLVFVMAQWPGFNWDAIGQGAEAIDRFSSLLHWTTITAVYVGVVAVKSWQQKVQAQADGLALRLALEQQHSLALRAQLEPHFMFNALNAISALVISDNKEVALHGIHGLSDLLRYALSATDRDWVSVGEELQFIDDYLALQRLRYGARLQLRIDGVGDAVRDVACPPLLLQPLIENALRHDLDCHEDASDILLALGLRDGMLHIHASNPARPEAAHNPGVGLGLRNIAARLQLAYGGAAAMRTGIVNGRFEVSLHLPLRGAA